MQTNGIYPESVLENEMHKHIRDFDIKTDHLISAGRPDQIIVDKKKKKNWLYSGF